MRSLSLVKTFEPPIRAQAIAHNGSSGRSFPGLRTPVPNPGDTARKAKKGRRCRYQEVRAVGDGAIFVRGRGRAESEVKAAHQVLPHCSAVQKVDPLFRVFSVAVPVLSSDVLDAKTISWSRLLLGKGRMGDGPLLWEVRVGCHF